MFFCLFHRTVCKEKTSDDREELALKTFTYKLDADEDDIVDPTLNKPGCLIFLHYSVIR